MTRPLSNQSLSALTDSYRAAEFIKLARLFMVWVGIPVILGWGIADYRHLGFQPFWMIYRGTFPIFTWLCVRLSKQHICSVGRYPKLPFVVYTFYILVMCSILIVMSQQNWRSQYFLGMPQIIIAMSLLPFEVGEFAAIMVVYSLTPVVVATWQQPFWSFVTDVNCQIYVTYSTFALLSYFAVRRSRERGFVSRALLIQEREQQSEIIATQARELSKAEVNAAIASMTQMLAHDVKRPFSLLKISLSLLAKAHDMVGVQHVLAKLKPEIDNALNSVDSMIADVMAIGTKGAQCPEDFKSPTTNLPKEPLKEPLALDSLMKSTMADLFRLHPEFRCHLNYDFQHSSAVMGDHQRIQRVFYNILANAVEAMMGGITKDSEYRHHLWIATKELPRSIEICVGNSGSWIPPVHRSRIFEAFFTHGKRNGTGLGLAIAQSIVCAHGGDIQCDSHITAEYPQGYVEFFVTLPKYIRSEILIVDDSLLALDAWQAALHGEACVHTAESFETLMTALSKDRALIDRIALVITDLNFDNSAFDGRDVARVIKSLRADVPILLSSAGANQAADSNGFFNDARFEGLFSGVVDKVPSSWQALNGLAKADSVLLW